MILPFRKKKATDPNIHVGKTLTCTCIGDHEPRFIKIERVIGSIVRPTRFEVTSEGEQHLVVMLDFFAQLQKDITVTPEMIREFDQMEYHVMTPDEMAKQKATEQTVKAGVDAAVTAAFKGNQDATRG